MWRHAEETDLLHAEDTTTAVLNMIEHTHTWMGFRC